MKINDKQFVLLLVMSFVLSLLILFLLSSALPPEYADISHLNTMSYGTKVMFTGTVELRKEQTDRIMFKVCNSDDCIKVYTTKRNKRYIDKGDTVIVKGTVRKGYVIADSIEYYNPW